MRLDGSLVRERRSGLLSVPNFDKAFVEDAKIYYLLGDEGKGKVFSSVGFSRAEPETLRQAVLNHARVAQVTKEERNPYGIKYAAKGRLRSPDGRDPSMLSVWTVEWGNDQPRFVTAYPANGEEES